MTHQIKALIILIVCLFIFAIIPACYAWQDKVVGISDGDTITVMHEGRGEKIRLYGIDTPEMGQPYGQKAKHFTSRMVFGKIVDVEPTVKDKYGRTVANVEIGGMSLNEELIKAGFAWVYTKYCDTPKCSDWVILEQDAKRQAVGLWSQPNPVPPWQYRHGGNTNKVHSTITKVDLVRNVFHGNTNSHVFHKSDGKYFDCKNFTAEFESREEAINAGGRPCKLCNP